MTHHTQTPRTFRLPLLALAMAAACALTTPAAHAATDECANIQTTLDQSACNGQTYDSLDKKLNTLYAAYNKRLKPTQKEQLKKAELAWIQFRDRSCDLQSSGVEGGSLHPVVYQECLISLTEKRIADIKALNACKDDEGDISCP